MNLKALEQRIKQAQESKNLTQGSLTILVDLNPTHISVIERGSKTVRLGKFIAITNTITISGFCKFQHL